MSTDNPVFLQWFKQASREARTTDDALAIILPLFQQVVKAHELGKVAPLDHLDKLYVTAGQLWFHEQDLKDAGGAYTTMSRLEDKLSNQAAIEVAGHLHIDETDGYEVTDTTVGTHGETLSRPKYLAGYISWEHEVRYHDQLTDIFSLGLLLASLVTGLDFTQKDELATFVDHRTNLFQLNDKLNPVVARAIMQMTALSRHDRVQDLAGVVHVLENYRYQVLEKEVEEGSLDEDQQQRRQRILKQLRDRLFEISRRNRMLYFKPSMSTLNLTEASVPVLLNHEKISADSLFTWRGEIAKNLSAGMDILLGNYIQFDEAPYVNAALDKLRSEDRRNRNEYGFSQLRLVIAFLRWHNLKESPDERITSPLLLLPVEIAKKKGVRDHYSLQPLEGVAEVNPVLRHQLDHLYGVKLPSEVDLAHESLVKFHQELETKLQATEAGLSLRLIDRPQIKLIHRRAKAKLDQFNRRRSVSGRGIKTWNDQLNYSYNRNNFQPLGLALFRHHIESEPSALGELVGSTPAPRTQNMSATATDTVEKTFYNLQDGADGNQYLWDFDLCWMTLANFSYRKMSLVRDYEALLGEKINNSTFESLFSLDPKPRNEDAFTPLPIEQSYQIVPADPTQSAAITQARAGESFIIQGPPGTGKSQTITNLIADYVARDKRVLFVCEKRAAIDVVFHRLKQHDLDSLCCLIHDSQSDKKPFIHDLKACYEHYLSNTDRLEHHQQAREKVVANIERVLNFFTRYNDDMQAEHQQHGSSLRKLLGESIALREHIPDIDAKDMEDLPNFQHFSSVRHLLEQVEHILQDLNEKDSLGAHPFRHLAASTLNAEKPLQHIEGAILKARAVLSELLDQLVQIHNVVDSSTSIATLHELLSYATQIDFLAQHKLLSLLDDKTELSTDLHDAVITRDELKLAISDAAELTTRWIEKIPAQDVPDIQALVSVTEERWYRSVLPRYWKLRGIFKRRYDASSHVVKPKWSRLLDELLQEHKAQQELKFSDRAFIKQFGLHTAPDSLNDAEEITAYLAALQGESSDLSPAQRALRDHLLVNPSDNEEVSKLLALKPEFERASDALAALLQNYNDASLTDIQHVLDALENHIGQLPDLVPALAELSEADPAHYAIYAKQPWSEREFSGAVVNAALQGIYRENRTLARQSAADMVQQIERLSSNLKQWQEDNAHLILNQRHAHFRQQVHKASLPANDQKDLKPWKQAYNSGRRELEHEFGKVMRYKSIRDLGANESGFVVADLKPIWLMSPLSVSDTLPLSEDCFDVVIFDEASQITTEEAIPALFRAKQTIIVGDEQQLPPSDFFSAKQSDDEDDVASYELDADSLLTQATRHLPSTMLGWHYRSRSEALINFSNASFYQRQLLTVPGCGVADAKTPLLIDDVSKGHFHSSHVLGRSISFCQLDRSIGIYTKRRNNNEAKYIAQLVRSLLMDESQGKTIGIVAFSEAQQDEIETELTRLGHEDGQFAALLEEEYQREEDDQFLGLFVKNLENVQGDERDIIIVSVCYGYDDSGKMRMNFGPINRRGGEKRLNVIFSRAKEHMVVVSSIRYLDITNDYNDGANCLKRYLRYAEAVSCGDTLIANRVLDECHPARFEVGESYTAEPLVIAVKEALEAKGYEVTTGVGDSEFRVDLAVKTSDDQQYRLGILLDVTHHYANDNLLESYFIKPTVLEVFGWQVLRIHAHDWIREQEIFMAQIERLLANKPINQQ